MADDRKAELIAALDRARSRLAVNAQALRRDIDVTRRVKQSFLRNRAAWFGGAALTGLLLSRLPVRTKKGVLNRKGGKLAAEKGALMTTVLLGALKMGFGVLKPWLTRWLGKRVTAFAENGGRRR